MKKRSFLYIIAIIIVSTVLVIMSVNAAYDYTAQKKQISEEMKKSSDLTLTALQKNIAGLMASFSVHEYNNMLQNEMETRETFAIIVEDFNMGKILGSKAYVSGKIRTQTGEIVDYNPQNTEHTQILQSSGMSGEREIVSKEGKKLGTVRVYISNDAMEHALKSVVLTSLINAMAVSVVMILALLVSIRYFLFAPLSQIVEAINQRDEDGIPTSTLNTEGPYEIAALLATMNRMIDATRTSRQLLQERHEELNVEKERFKLAIEGTRDGLWDWNLQTGIVLRSPRFETMLGYEVGELPETIECWSELLHPDDKDEAHQKVQEYLDAHGEGVYESTFRMQTKGGEWRWIIGRGKALFDENGTPLRFVGFNTDITELITQQEELKKQKNILQHQAYHDALTGLANRELFNDRLMQGIKKAQRAQSKIAVLFVDLDHFKEINDSFGHKTGDKVLQITTQRLNGLIRQEDTLARLGGDEFTIMIEGLSEVQDASIFAEKILKALSEPIKIEEQDLYVGCSIGISLYPDNGKSAEDLLKYADVAMYKAKHEGRNNFQYYSADMTEKAFERVRMETNLREALKNGELVVHYQPQVNSRSGKIEGLEALVRWNSLAVGMVQPAKFIPIAESSGLIVELDRFVMKEAMQQIVRWYEAGLEPGKVSMNLTLKQLHQKDFFSFLKELMKESRCRPEWMELEMTETQMMTHPEETAQLLLKITALGITLAMDDFGTGYSSLSYLKKLPISKLKIDRSFIKDLPYDEEDVELTKAIIAMAKTLRLNVIAEGAETKEQQEFLLKHGCESIQGYLYAKPMSSAEAEHFLKEGA